MLCEKCNNAIVLDAFSKGECDICNKPIYYAHMPCAKICIDCSNKFEICELCGEKL